MNQRVPSWNVDDPPKNHLVSSAAAHVPTLPNENGPEAEGEGEVAELMWQNGQLSAHGLGHPRKTRPCGETLEAVVDQATRALLLVPVPVHVSTPAATCGSRYPPSSRKRGKAGGGSWGSERVAEHETGFTATSATRSPEDDGGWPDTDYTSLGGKDSAPHSKPSQRDRTRRGGEDDDEEEKTMRGRTGVSSISTKRGRAASIHNLSERKRRDRINQKMTTLQKLVPNSSKTDKASMLDEVIEYLKQLQAQIQMMSRMSSISPMMMPMNMNSMQHLQMSMMAQMAQMAQMTQMGMGMGMGMLDLSSLGRTGIHGMPPILPPSPFIPLVGEAIPLVGASGERGQQLAGQATINQTDPFLACLGAPPQQPINMDAYNKMVALYRQLYQPASTLENPNK